MPIVQGSVEKQWKDIYLYRNRKLQTLFSFCLSLHQLFSLSALGSLHQKGAPVWTGGLRLRCPQLPCPGARGWLLPVLPPACPGTWVWGNAPAGWTAASLLLLLRAHWLQPLLVLLPKWRLRSSSRLLTATYWIIVEYMYVWAYVDISCNVLVLSINVVDFYN